MGETPPCIALELKIRISLCQVPSSPGDVEGNLLKMEATACSASDMSKIQFIAQANARRFNMVICYVNYPGGKPHGFNTFSGGSFIVSPLGVVESAEKATAIISCTYRDLSRFAAGNSLSSSRKQIKFLYLNSFIKKK